MTHAQIVLSTLVGIVGSVIVVVLHARWSKSPTSFIDVVRISATVGVSILLWREAGNTPALNDDPLPLVSPNDVLCPVLTYVSLGLLASFIPAVRTTEWPRLRAVLTLLSLVVNIVTI